MGQLDYRKANEHAKFMACEAAGPLSEEQFENGVLFDQVPVGVAFVGPSGVIIRTNSYAAQLAGCRRAELEGALASSFIRGRASIAPDPGTVDRVEEEIPIRIRRKDGTTLRGWLKKIPVKHPDRPTTLLIFGPAPTHLAGSLEYTATAPFERSPPQLDGVQIIGKSKAIRNLCEFCSQIARSDCTVLIQGESGTGKELFASAIHHHSNRAEAPFVRLNCVAISETLFESELFGHVKGAFTGAYRARKGRFHKAEGGTILLDEIGCMSLSGQAKLLRVIQEREFEPVGSSQSVRCNVRIIATTNINLEEAVQNGSFREDLYYRLNVFNLDLPALKYRKEDIPLLATFFLRKYVSKMNKTTIGFDPEAMTCLLNFDWPGNVRELKNVVEHAMVVTKRDYIFRTDLPGYLSRNLPDKHRVVSKELNLRRKLEILERQIVLQTLHNENWVKRKAAKQLGIDPRNFNYFLKKHNIVHSA